MKKAFVIGTLLVVLTLSLGGSAVSKVTDNAATYEQLRLFTEVLSSGLLSAGLPGQPAPREERQRDQRDG